MSSAAWARMTCSPAKAGRRTRHSRLSCKQRTMIPRPCVVTDHRPHRPARPVHGDGGLVSGRLRVLLSNIRNQPGWRLASMASIHEAIRSPRAMETADQTASVATRWYRPDRPAPIPNRRRGHTGPGIVPPRAPTPDYQQSGTPRRMWAACSRATLYLTKRGTDPESLLLTQQPGEGRVRPQLPGHRRRRSQRGHNLSEGAVQ
jgi:hypothetical protein